MASLLGNPASRFSDNLICHVQPRVPVSHSQTGVLRTSISSNAPHVMMRTPYQLSEDSHVATSAFLSLSDPRASMPLNSIVNLGLMNQDLIQPKAKKRKLSDYYKSPLRRRQCRTNQARYRNKQREYQSQLEQSVEQLREEVTNLKRKYRGLSCRERINQSPWSIVAEVFRLVESSFRSPWRTVNAEEMKNHTETRQILAVLEKAFFHDATIGDLHGVDTLLQQLRRFSQYFADPQFKLLQVESMTPGVMTARAKLSVTVSELSLKNIFVVDDGTPRYILRNRLPGQCLEFNCTMNFLFDEESCRVVRLESKIDLVVELLRSLGNLSDVSDVLEHALITPECIIRGGQTCRTN